MLKRLISIIPIIIIALSSFAQDGHISYKRHGNTKHLGRTVAFRTDSTNIDTLTSVYNGTIAFDTLAGAAVVYDGTGWKHLSAGGVVRDTVINILTADVLTLNGTPVDAILAPGAGYAVQVLNGAFSVSFNSVAYATNTTLLVITETAARPQLQADVLGATASRMSAIPAIDASHASASQIIENKKVQIQADVGEPTAGDSNIKIYLQYRVIKL